MDLAMVATDWAYHIVAPVNLAGLPPEGAEVPTMLRGPGMFGNIVRVPRAVRRSAVREED